MRYRIVLVLLVIGATFAYAQKASKAVVDLGWITVVEESRGWRVTESAQGLDTRRSHRLKTDDLLLSIDGHDLSSFGSLGIARMLNDVPIRRVPITLERSGKLYSILAIGEGVLTDGTMQSSPRYNVDELQRRSATAPGFSLPDLNGRNHELRDFRGKWLLIVFWGTWCGGCVEEIPDLESLASEHKGKLAVVGIALNDSPEKLKSFVAERQLSYLVLQGGRTDGPTARRYNFVAAPLDVLISPEGDVVIVAESTPYLRREVEAIIVGRDSNSKHSEHRF